MTSGQIRLHAQCWTERDLDPGYYQLGLSGSLSQSFHLSAWHLTASKDGHRFLLTLLFLFENKKEPHAPSPFSHWTAMQRWPKQKANRGILQF